MCMSGQVTAIDPLLYGERQRDEFDNTAMAVAEMLPLIHARVQPEHVEVLKVKKGSDVEDFITMVSGLRGPLEDAGDPIPEASSMSMEAVDPIPELDEVNKKMQVNESYSTCGCQSFHYY